jgi:hypothetical protein
MGLTQPIILETSLKWVYLGVYHVGVILLKAPLKPLDTWIYNLHIVLFSKEVLNTFFLNGVIVSSKPNLKHGDSSTN